MSSALSLCLVALVPVTLASQMPNDSVRVSNQPRYTAADGSVSAIVRGEPGPNGRWSYAPEPNGFTLSFVIDDANACAGPHSVEHQIRHDTLAVTLFFDTPRLCPGIITPREYKLHLTHLKDRYLLRVYFEGRGGRGGAARGDDPWITVWADW